MDNVKRWIRPFICFVRKGTKYLRYNFCYPFHQRIYVWRLRRKEVISVVFFASNLAMWKYQHLYERLSANRHFKTYIVISTFLEYSLTQQANDARLLREHFLAHNMTFIDYEPSQPDAAINVRDELNPDILFYPQPYYHILNNKHDSSQFENKLICYYPYSFWIGKDDWGYNLSFHNIAWKLYYATKYNEIDAKRLAINQGHNVVVVGYPNMDDYLSLIPNDVWKKQIKKKKRIIYAPHFTINADRCYILQSSFIENGEYMLELAKQYQDDAQFAFKPHPRLKTELYLHPAWGKEKTDKYYNEWATLQNCQYEEGSYIDLFLTSDAIIHDCGSFILEYLFTKNPALYISHDINFYRTTLNELGNKALDVYYIGLTKESISDFIKDIVLGKKDPLKESRNEFFKKNLLPPNGKSVVDNTMDDLLKSLRINNG